MIAQCDIERARSRFDVIAGEVKLTRSGREWAGCCPFHKDKTASFYVAPDKGFFHCFGCGAHGTAIDYLMRARNLGFLAAVRELLLLPAQRPRAAAPANERAKSDASAGVAQILAGCGPVADTTAAWLYLRLRGLISRFQHRPPSAELLAHPALYCADTRQPLQAMVAPIRNRDGIVTAVQRFYLRPAVVVYGENEAGDNRADVKTRKKSLGPFGEGAVRLAVPGKLLGLSEGVESALAAQLLFNLPVWATCGASRLGSIWMPPDVEQIVIFGDRGEAGEAAATKAGALYRERGYACSLVLPDAPYQDFNDQLLGRRR